MMSKAKFIKQFTKTATAAGRVEIEMTENTPLPVKGYTLQSDENVALANEGKELEERYLRWLDKMLRANGTHSPGADEKSLKYDPRFIALARTHIQTGAMFAIRAIFKPTRIKLPED